MIEKNHDDDFVAVLGDRKMFTVASIKIESESYKTCALAVLHNKTMHRQRKIKTLPIAICK